MKSFKVIIVLAIVLCLGAIMASGVTYGQTFMVDQTGDTAFAYSLDCQQNELNDMPAAVSYDGMPASGQSIIFQDGVPTTVIGADGTSTPYSASMWDFLGGYVEMGPETVGISSNPDVPTGGTWKWTDESGTFGTQEPNLNIS